MDKYFEVKFDFIDFDGVIYHNCDIPEYGNFHTIDGRIARFTVSVESLPIFEPKEGDLIFRNGKGVKVVSNERYFTSSDLNVISIDSYKAIEFDSFPIILRNSQVFIMPEVENE